MYQLGSYPKGYAHDGSTHQLGCMGDKSMPVTWELGCSLIGTPNELLKNRNSGETLGN